MALDDHWLSISNIQYQDDFKDFTFIVGNREFKVHKCIFAAKSEVLKTMFTCGFEESESNSTKITDIIPEVFQVLVDFMYGNKEEFLRNIEYFVFSICAAAHKYEIKILQDFCVDHILTGLAGLDVYGTYAFASFYDLDKLKLPCWKKIVSESLKNGSDVPQFQEDYGQYYMEFQRYQESLGKMKRKIKQKILSHKPTKRTSQGIISVRPTIPRLSGGIRRVGSAFSRSQVPPPIRRLQTVGPNLWDIIDLNRIDLASIANMVTNRR